MIGGLFLSKNGVTTDGCPHFIVKSLKINVCMVLLQLWPLMVNLMGKKIDTFFPLVQRFFLKTFK
jgi:hypothetical protein